jgi:hypothetical protein
MRKQQATRKLGLVRETLAPLQADALDSIVGGNVITVSFNHCPTLVPARSCLLCIPDAK